ncbi:MAG: hypothetical protein EBR82_45170, partial [Caulobacteraceae bacterium]|nr:hypothetical protein [Caulobacteraceae bacterium]
MSLENAINTPPGEYIRGGFAATIQMPQTRQTKTGKAFYVAKAADGAHRADLSSFSQDFSKYDGQRVHFSGMGLKRGDDYNGTAKITIGDKAVWKSLGAGDEAAESHSEATQAFPTTKTYTSNTPSVYLNSPVRVEGAAVGNALTNATSLAIAGKIQSEALESFLFHTASKYLRTANKLLAGELSPSNILEAKEVGT